MFAQKVVYLGLLNNPLPGYKQCLRDPGNPFSPHEHPGPFGHPRSHPAGAHISTLIKYFHLAYAGHLFQELKEFCGSFDAGMKGLTLSNSDQVEKLSVWDEISTFFQTSDPNCAQFLRQADTFWVRLKEGGILSLSFKCLTCPTFRRRRTTTYSTLSASYQLVEEYTNLMDWRYISEDLKVKLLILFYFCWPPRSQHATQAGPIDHGPAGQDWTDAVR